MAVNLEILCTYDYGQEEFDLWASYGFTVRYVPERLVGPDTPLDTVDILICYNPFQTLPVTALKRLKYLLLSSIGFDQVPAAILEIDRITITNNHGGYSPPIGEWIVMRLLMGFKQASRQVLQSRNKLWRLHTDLLELTEKKIVFLGTGTLAQEAVKRLQGFDCHIEGVNTKGHPVPGFSHCYPLTALHTAVTGADAVVCCLPLTNETKGLLDADFFKTLKRDSIFINISRGAVVDEAALLDYLQGGGLRFCALDVFVEEPLPEVHPLWALPQVLVSAHQSWVSELRNTRRLETIRHNLRCIAAGDLENIHHRIDKKRGY